MVKAQDIKEHMEVIAADGKHVGTVDCLKGTDKIVLTKNDPQSGGQHHIIPIGWIDHVDAHVHLSKPARQVMLEWQTAA
jgi:hypothetical protein